MPKNLTSDYMHDVVHRYLMAVNAADPETVVGLFSDQACLEDPVGMPPIRGQEAIRCFYASLPPIKVHLHLQGPIRAVAGEAVFALCGTYERAGVRTQFYPINHIVFDRRGLITHLRAWLGASNIHRTRR
ncbi:nuclear transport factor 2 family protein [Stenotrophomonas sp. NA06056]|uniref:nuclear transport factor 2 family protein n=1 Tax=Stenotrophomonas sp. NA06056 TaxID=2742129 RepID=UPI00158C05AD|nr:nuclear transport factor 2 family protein [Stenotrophomonas sp. NA06056]QKW55403.1 nuclear transport factor 2 family protein [Stenotrophomonas sp. NA06056]